MSDAPMGDAPTPVQELAHRLREVALTYPEAWEDFPWGELAVKVRKKAFVFMGSSETELSFSIKLRQQHAEAMAAPFVEPCGYGLGRHGWVTVRISDVAAVGPDQLRDWIDESYRLVAPKTLVKALDARA